MVRITSKTKVNFKDGLIRKKAEQAFENYVGQISNQFQKEIEAVQWDWTPGVTTRRRNGEPVTRPRDIVDTGQLRDSQTAPVIRKTTNGPEATITWTAPYASIVLGEDIEGKGFNGANYPARNWIRSAVQKLPLYEFMVKRLLR